MTIDYTSLITSEYKAQPNFNATVALTANGIGDITDAIDSLPALFDIDVALQNQLDIDGQWVGFARTVGGVVTVGFFGFADDASALTFGELGNAAIGGQFFDLGGNTGATAILADPQYRQLLMAKIVQNDWDGSITEFEAAAADIIPVPCQFFDMGNKVVSIVPSQTLDPVLIQLLTGFDMLPRPGGVRYELFAPLTPLNWTLAGTASVDSTGTILSKKTGAAAWDSAAWLAEPFAANFITWTLTGSGGTFMGGLSANPSGSPNYPNLNFGIFVAAAAQLSVWESGVNVAANLGVWSPGDEVAVLMDKRGVFYFHNGKMIYASTASPPAALSPMFCLFSVEASALISSLALQTGN